MFQLGYLLVILLAALPLGRTFLNQQAGGSQVLFVHRLYRDLAYVAAAVLGIICLETALTISLQDYWFDELGQRYRYWLALGLRSGIFVTVVLSIGIFTGYNLRALCRPLPAVPRSAPWFAAFILAGLVALGTATLWVPLLGFLGATDTGTRDPVFGNDISFYLLALPLYEDVVGIVMTALVIMVMLWTAIGFWLYPRSGRPWDWFADYLAQRSTPSLRIIGAVDAPRTQNEMVWGRWIRQGLMLGALVCLASGVARFLGRYYLIIDGHSQVVAGGSYADVNFWIPAYNAVVVGWVAAAFILMAAACVTRIRIWLLTRPSHWVVPCVLFVALYLGAAIVPEAVERLYVGPNQITLELPYLLRSIAGTRQAYNLEGPSVEEREFAVSADAVNVRRLGQKTPQRCRTRASGIGARSSRNCSRSRACGRITRLHGVDIDRYHDRRRRAAGHDHGAGTRRRRGFPHPPRSGSISRSNTPTVTASLRSR